MTTTTRKETFSTVVEATGDNPSIMISTIAEDRDGDVIIPEGVELANYQKNPAVLYGHDSRDLPVGATTSLDVQPGRGLRARWRWLEGDARAARVRNAFDQGVLRAASVGFRALEAEPRGDGRGFIFRRWELLEWSLVPIPANPQALRQLKCLGLDCGGSDLKLIDVPSDFQWRVERIASELMKQEIADQVDRMRGRIV